MTIAVTRTYSISKQNKVRQLRENADYERTTVHRIIDAGLVAHVAFVQEGLPVVVPMIYGREDETLFLHGARKARVIRLLEQTDQACVNVTLLDGIVVARSVFNSSMNYRSATVFGRPRLLKTREEELHGLNIISEHTIPGRWVEVRESHEREIKMTGVIAMPIDSASAKIASGMPDDEDEDYDIPIWAGVLPITSTLGQLQSDNRLLPGVEPSDAIRSMQNRVL
jgi:nitroimidazol reductase NimA-like FMN-containing flavoprotein (pyridoxamine 5'-phosphate oxidase superfamily)